MRSPPVTSKRPSGSHPMEWPRPDGPLATTWALPSRSTATMSGVPQCGNHKRPSCQRGDSPMARPLSSTRVSMLSRVMASLLPSPVRTAPRRIDTTSRKINSEGGFPVSRAPASNPRRVNVFEHIYRNDLWHGGSGPGSLPSVNRPYVRFLHGFLRANQIQTVVDLGCGDWQFSRRIDWGGARYLGLDVV